VQWVFIQLNAIMDGDQAVNIVPIPAQDGAQDRVQAQADPAATPLRVLALGE
jgi:hypothetical protein